MTTCRKIQIDSYSTPRITLNPKYIKDLKSRPDTLSIIEGNVGIVLKSLVQERVLEMDTITQEIRTTVNKEYFMKQKSLLWQKTPSYGHSDNYRMKINHYTFNKGLVFEIYKNLKTQHKGNK